MLIDALLAIVTLCIDIAYALYYIPIYSEVVRGIWLFLFKARLAFPG